MKERRVDVAFWPAEEVDGLALFRKLQQKWEQKYFDDEFVMKFISSKFVTFDSSV